MKYIIYVRKSTDENSEHQKQSIPDQIVKCIEFAQNNWLILEERPSDFSEFETNKDIEIEEKEEDETNRQIYRQHRHLFIVRERESAKEPYKRPKWRKIIEWIKQWKIKWILSYSPDRQARNLLEAGELIDLVDKWLLDLKYTNFHFEPNASWKMMLWIWFVFSKQYSDKLSEDITRWNLSKLEKGYALWRYKWWYIINEEWFHEPDPENFELLKKAFHMKIYEDKTNEFIVNRLYKKGFYRLSKKWKKLFLSSRAIQDVFKDTFYYWELKYGDKTTNLTKTNKYFKPIINYEEYQLLQSKIKCRIVKVADNPNSIYLSLKPFRDNFLITEDNYKCSFYISKAKTIKAKIKKLINKNQHIDLDTLNLSVHRLHYIISRKSKIRKYITYIKAIDIFNLIKESFWNITLTKTTIKQIINSGKKFIDNFQANKESQKEYLSTQIKKLKEELRQVIIKSNLLSNPLEKKIFEEKRNELIKKFLLYKKKFLILIILIGIIFLNTNHFEIYGIH